MRRASLAVALATIVVSSSSGPSGAAPSTAIVALDASHPTSAFRAGAVGLSIETWELKGLSAAHYRIVRLMRLLGPSVLRVGGNSVDLSWWTSNREPAPAWATNTVTPADLQALQRLLAATGWRVLLGVNLGHFEPSRAADEARYAHRTLGARLLGIEIGNEPDDFGKRPKLRPPTYGASEYLSEAEAYDQAVSAAAGGVGVYGPALARTEWLGQLGAGARMFAGLTQHYYPTNTCPGAGPRGSTPEPTAAELLSPGVRHQEDDALRELSAAAGALGRPAWIGETNTAACGGSRYASSTFASALWGLDWALRAASVGAEGIDFHGAFSICGPLSEAPICAPGKAAARAGIVRPQPEYYGLLAARQLEGGRFIPASVIGPSPPPDVTAWATLATDGTVRVALDDLATAGAPQTLSIPMRGYAGATEQLLSAPAGPSARSGVTLGAASVTSQALWQPRASGVRDVHHALRLVLSPSSAAVVVLRPRAAHHGRRARP